MTKPIKRLVLRRGLQPNPPVPSKAVKRKSAKIHFRDLGLDLAIAPGLPRGVDGHGDAPGGYVYVYRFEALLYGMAFTLFGQHRWLSKESPSEYAPVVGRYERRLMPGNTVVCVSQRDNDTLLSLAGKHCLGQIPCNGSRDISPANPRELR